jgi:hypothetical protein
MRFSIYLHRVCTFIACWGKCVVCASNLDRNGHLHQRFSHYYFLQRTGVWYIVEVFGLMLAIKSLTMFLNIILIR